MSDNIMTREEYQKITKENKQLFSRLDEQISKERVEEDKRISSLSEEEQESYLLSEIDVKDKFNKTQKLISKKDGE